MKQNSTPFDVTEYDKQIKRTLPFYEEMIQQIVDIIRVLDWQSIKWLDVGCGTGKMVRTALDNFNIQKIVCIDVEKEMLEKAENFCDDGKIDFLQCDVRELPYQEMFDIVTAVQVNHYFKKEERITAIKKCYDALEENGIYISFENFAPDSEKGTRLYLERWKQFQIANGKTEEEAPPKSIIKKPELQVYVFDFWKKDDCCLVAETDEEIIGAVWTRIMDDMKNDWTCYRLEGTDDTDCRKFRY